MQPPCTLTGSIKTVAIFAHYGELYNIYAVKWIYNHDKGYPTNTFRGMLIIFDLKTPSQMENKKN